MSLSLKVLRFGLVGVVGFVIDGGLLWVLVGYGANPFIARGLSFPSAVVVTWWLNRMWTFIGSAKVPRRRQLKGYFLLQVIGAIANFCVYVAVLSSVEHTPLNALAALAVGAVVGMVVNFVGARKYVFKSPTPNS